MRLLKRLRYWVEASGFFLICLIFFLLPTRVASAFGGWLARTFGPLFPLSRRAERNVAKIFPEMEGNRKKALIQDMWENLGRVAAEYCHLSYFMKQDVVEIEGRQWLEEALSKGHGALIVGAHLGNLQMIAVAASKCGIPVAQFYRQANNPYVDFGMRRLQAKVVDFVVPKRQGTRGLLKVLKKGYSFILFIDQKFSEGKMIPFLGHMAATMTFPIELSQRWGYPLVCARVERIEGVRFRVTFYPPLVVPKGPVEGRETLLNERIGEWVRARPEQWMWIHDRWRT